MWILTGRSTVKKIPSNDVLVCELGMTRDDVFWKDNFHIFWINYNFHCCGHITVAVIYYLILYFCELEY